MEPKTFKAPPIKIEADDPFKFDCLNRKDGAEILTDFVASLDGPFVLAIDSPWGTGKTTFLNMWLQYARNKKFQTLYFNAWENDFSDSPLVSLIGELGDGILALQLDEGQKKLARKIFKKAKNAGAALVKTALPTVIKLATSGLIDVEVANLAEEIAKKEIDKYQEDKKTSAHFRHDLEELAKSVAVKKQSQNQPILFVIDELDRCRPTYAIELLEKVKHLFSVKGFVFVLAIDKRQLCEAVRALYGDGVDSDGYLRRFIDLEYRLPEPDIASFVSSHFSRFGLDKLLASKSNSTGIDAGLLLEILLELLRLFCFSLRVQEQIFTQLSIVVRTTALDHYLFPFQLCLLICLRTKKRELYLQYINCSATPDDVMNFLKSLPGGEKFAASRNGRFLEAHLIFGISDYKKREAAKAAICARCNTDATNNSPDMRAREIVDNFHFIGQRPSDITGYLVKKIELSDRFVSQGAEPE